MAQKTSSCYQCHFEFNVGAHVCQGCRGDIVYGATQGEVAEASKIGAGVFGVASLALIYAAPFFLNKYASTDIQVGWGMGFYGLGIAAAAAVVGAYKFTSDLHQRKRSSIRTFRR
ncbi:hypothetical protein [Janthinobacterium sp. 1_2014MBL_MicDiv]|uniref:hypothetical protein n=1 Tax=Janthinobacterium sp. 1_2014MBL_MicDiv TaxID=1644131 RepID=UPI0012EB87F9|nr:hypothetical protein [Janthinobacterium sp. 1_2014MBL_MicDiv]